MTKIRAVNNKWEWLWGRSKGNYAQESRALALDLKMQIQSWVGDCFFSTEDYIDWNYLLGSKNTEDEIQEVIRALLDRNAEVAGVTDVTATVDRENRKISVTYSYIDIFGGEMREEINV